MYTFFHRGRQTCQLRKRTLYKFGPLDTTSRAAMAPIEKKRSRKATHDLPRKRRKGDQPIERASIRGSKPQTPSLDSLPWHEVPFPENYQDAEGFYCLEELSDVDVVKDTGKIEYKV